MFQAVSFLILCNLALGLARLTPDERLACTKGIVCGVSKDQLDFFVVGDTGGAEFNTGVQLLSYVRPTRVQTRVAEAMAKLATNKGLDFIINVGDNVYFNGVDTENDTRFEAVFEKPYSAKTLQVPWYMIAGNHDYLGNVQAQINYTMRSDKWTFPSPYYKLAYSFAQYSKTVDFLFIDTIIACGNTIDIESRSVFSWMSAFEKVPLKPDPPFVEEAKKQWTWLEEELKQSTADYLFVIGHYPMYSLALGELKCLHEKLDPLLRKYRVTAYLSGHEHSIQYYRDDGDKDRVPMRYLISGAGSRTGAWGSYLGDEKTKLLYRYPKKVNVPFIQTRHIQQKNEFGYGEGGFVHFSARQHRVDLYFYARDLELEFQESIAPRNLKELGINPNSRVKKASRRRSS